MSSDSQGVARRRRGLAGGLLRSAAALPLAWLVSIIYALLASVLGQGVQGGAAAFLAISSVYTSALFLLAVVSGLALSLGFSSELASEPGHERRKNPPARTLVLVSLGACAAAFPLSFVLRPIAVSLCPEHLAFQEEIGRIVAVHVGVGVALLGSHLLWKRRTSEPYPFMSWALVHLLARLATQADLLLFGARYANALDLLSLMLTFACALSWQPPREGRAASVHALVVAALIAQAVLGLWQLDRGQLARANLAASSPSAASMLSLLRKLHDMDGDGFSARLGGGDCDDGDARVHPLALEIVGNGIDDNCIGGDLAAYAQKRPPALRQQAPRHNLILVTVDALRADMWRDTADGQRPMPNTKKLAERAAVFPNTYSQAPFTTDSLSSLLTGRYPMNMTLGTQWLGSEPDLPVLLRGAGYATVALQQFTQHDPDTDRPSEALPFFLRGFERVDLSLAPRNASFRGRTSEDMTSLALRQLDELRARDKPFFLWIHYFDPHGEYLSHEGTPFPGDDARSRYLQEVWSTDAALGRLYDHLEATSYFDSGALALVGDHGELLGEQGFYGHAVGVEDLALRTLALVRGPGVPAGVHATRVRVFDLFPTLLDVCAGVRVDVDAAHLAPVWSGQERADRRVVARTTYAGGQFKRVVLEGSLRLVQDVVLGTLSLHDLARDPGQLHELVEAEPARRDALLHSMGVTFDQAMNDRVLAARARR